MRRQRDDSTRSPGRPSGPTANALGEYLRQLRLAKGWTIRELAREVSLPDSSAGYISQLETGAKGPNSKLARRLADRLGDPKGVFPLWAKIGIRQDPYESAMARRELAHVLEDPSINFDPRFSRPGSSRFERMQELLRVEASEPGEGSFESAAVPARLPLGTVRRSPGGGYRVLILPEGADPDTAHALSAESPESPQVEFVRFSPDDVGSRTLVRPVAYRMTETSVRRLTSVLKPGDVVVVSQDPISIVENEIYAIRVGGRVEFSHALWNRHQLLLLPDNHKSDFLVLPANDAQLGRLVVGHVVTVIREPAAG